MKNKRLVKYLCICMIITSIIGIIYMGCYLHRIHLPKSHIFVDDNVEEDSEFDKWIKNEVGVDWVPSYVVIQDKKVIGVFNGDLDEPHFTNQLGTVLVLPQISIDVTDTPIESLDGNKYNLLETLYNPEKPQNCYILEVVWDKCPDCEHQDKHYTNSIYAKYSTDRIYRYYIKTNKEDID